MLKYRRVGYSLLCELRQAAFASTRPARSYSSTRFQCRGFTNNKTNYGDRKLEGPIYEDTEPTSTWRYYVLPGALLALAGIGTLIHYNDERRAIPKDSKYKFNITPVYITLDPQRDSPAHLKTYLEEFGMRILGLTGSFAAVRQMAQQYRVFFKKVDETGQDYLVECSHNMYLWDPNLETVRIFGVEYNPLELADAIMAEYRKAQK